MVREVSVELALITEPHRGLIQNTTHNNAMAEEAIATYVVVMAM
jgi:hypothetical protein